ncbi:YiiX/YebB-like N1pC/P60 family cysteine hydrolase [Methylolobus aquaticus]
MNKIVLMAAWLFFALCSSATAGSGKNILNAADIQPTATEAEASNAEDQQVVIDITRGLLQINRRVLWHLSRFLPASETSAITTVRQHFSNLTRKLDTQPDAVLSATQDSRLESLLKKFGPDDPFASLPFLPESELKPGDIILRCSTALSSQMTELMIWSRYTHSALYLGNGMIIDATWQHGVKTRSLADFLQESNRVGVLRLQGLTSDQANQVISAAESKESSAYNFEAVRVLGVQKLDAFTHISPKYLSNIIGVLNRAEYLPQDVTGSGQYACSELISSAFKAINITLSQASGFTPGDMIRLSQAGFLSEVGRLQVPVE